MVEKLAERDEEEKILAKVYSECAMGRGRVVAISGPLASGKTTLLRSFTQDAGNGGATVLAATASSLERYHPLGIIDQMLRGRQLSAPDAEQKIRELLEAACDSAGTDETTALGQISLPTLNLLHSAFGHLADGQPLIVCVDDAHFMDIESLQYLLALARRLGNAPVVFVFSYCRELGRKSVQRIFQAEILRLPDCCLLPLRSLTTTGVTAVLGEYFGLAAASRLAAAGRQLSGGKPLLVRALAEDSLAASQAQEPGAGPAAPGQLVAGPAFGRAVLNCLYRSEPSTLELAQVIALLGRSGSLSAVAQFAGTTPEEVRQAMASAGLGGLLDDGFLGQPSVRKAVLESIPPSARQAMHARAAHLLHDEGAPAPAVAEHLAVIEDEEVPWASKVLCEAADQALVAGDHEAAVGYLRQAYRACPGRRERASISVKLTDIMWQHNPSAAKRYLPGLVKAMEDGYLTIQQSVQVITNLLWHGEVAPAADVLAVLRQGARPETADHASCYVDQLFLWLPLTYPGIAPRGRCRDVLPAGAVTPALAPERRAVAALDAVLGGSGQAAAVRAADLVLREAQAGVANPASSIASLVALIYSDQLGKASMWCDFLLAESEQHGPVWRAMLISARAAVYYRLGDLTRAGQRAHEALSLMPPESWGAALVLPLAFLVLTLTAMGRYADADSYLKFPVPPAAFETLGGLHYLDARGHFCLATGRYDAALQDFLECGQLAKLWDTDCPAAVPWRIGAAQACLCKGLTARAGELISEQLAMLPPGHSRTHAMTYRVHAATLDLTERPAVLLRAASIFESCGDSLGLACTLADLSYARQSLGDGDQARAAAHRAMALAGECGAAPLRSSLAAITEASSAAAGLTEPRAVPRLSKAEMRVAQLAAAGSTNEQIARKLFITVSTVEQHLTHVYRKLAIRRRTELPA